MQSTRSGPYANTATDLPLNSDTGTLTLELRHRNSDTQTSTLERRAGPDLDAGRKIDPSGGRLFATIRRMQKTLCVGAAWLLALVGFGVGSALLERRAAAAAAAAVQAPRFEVDPLWPMPLPNK